MSGGQEKNFSTLGPKLRGNKAQQDNGDKQRQICIEVINYRYQEEHQTTKPTPQSGPMMSHGTHGGGQPQPAGIRPEQQLQYNAEAEPQGDAWEGWEFVESGGETQAPRNQRSGPQPSHLGASSRHFGEVWGKSLRPRPRSQQQSKDACKNQ